MDTFAIRGNILYAPTPSRLELRANSYAVCEDGLCVGVFSTLNDDFSSLPVYDFGDMLVIPGYVDLHLHAPQYQNCGLGMDMELLDWLNAHTFPTEAKFADTGYAEIEYERFSEDLRISATTRACVFGTMHTDATVLLMEKLESTGLNTMVGKVNMDRFSPNDLCEKNPEASLAAVESWLSKINGRFKNTAPILTPRFVPSCSDALLEGIGEMSELHNLPIQSHLSENLSEVNWVLELHPDCPNYASIYDKFGLMGDKTIMAHCVHLTDDEIEIMRRTRTYVAHCPTSNINIRSGIAPVRKYLDNDILVGLGSDVSGGHTLDMTEVIRETLGLSKLMWCIGGEKYTPLKAAEAFYLATRGGGAFFGNVGSFEPGFEFDAVIIDDSSYYPNKDQDLKKRFEKMIYLSDTRNVFAKFVAGKRLF